VSTITGRQIRAARGLLGWSAREAAEQSGLSLPTVQRLEKYEGISPTVQNRTIENLRRAFEAVGIEFIGTPEDSPGVRINLKRQV
jgi:transcriptional regulator with XRE-family HTH domain